MTTDITCLQAELEDAKAFIEAVEIAGEHDIRISSYSSWVLSKGWKVGPRRSFRHVGHICSGGKEVLDFVKEFTQYNPESASLPIRQEHLRAIAAETFSIIGISYDSDVWQHKEAVEMAQMFLEHISKLNRHIACLSQEAVNSEHGDTQ